MPCWTLILLIPLRLWAAEQPELIQRIAKLNWHSTSPAEIQQILQTSDWEATVWNYLSELAVQARDVSIIQRFSEDVREIQRSGDPGGGRMLLLQQELAAERPQIGRAYKAQQEFGRFTDSLARLMDTRVVRLLGPFVEEREDTTFEGDTRDPSTRDHAIQTISYMAYRGLPVPSPVPGYGGSGDVEKWRQWWATNKEQFGLVLRLPPAKDTTEPSPKTAALAKSETTASAKPVVSQVTAITKPEGQSPKVWMLISIGVLLLAGLIVFAAKPTRKQ